MAIYIIIEVSYLDILMKQKSEITINKFERIKHFTNNYCRVLYNCKVQS